MNNTKPKEKPGFRARTVFNKAYPVNTMFPGNGSSRTAAATRDLEVPNSFGTQTNSGAERHRMKGSGNAGSVDNGKSGKKNRTQSVISLEEGPAAGSVVVDYGGVNGFKLQL